VDPTAGLDDLGKRKFLSLPGPLSPTALPRHVFIAISVSALGREKPRGVHFRCGLARILTA
jgi:hypothetical protein